MKSTKFRPPLPSDMAIKPHDSHHQLKPVLSAFDLILLGIGAIVGGGIFVLTGIAAATKAGPAVLISYIIAAIACCFAALAYAELAAALGGCGSAYGYSKAGFGTTTAWIVGWALILEYGIGTAAVAVGWSGYVVGLLQAMSVHFPELLANAPDKGGWVNLPAVFIIAMVGMLLVMGAKSSARLNKIMVTVKFVAILIFIYIAAHHINFAHWHPFNPFGWHGIMSGAAFIFFTYIGFDAVSTAAEETINPQRNMPIGIIGSLLICMVLYIIVSSLLTLIVPYYTLNVSAPMTTALFAVGSQIGAAIVSIGTIAGLTTVILAFYFGLTRIILAMCRDHLFPQQLARFHASTHTPLKIILLIGLIMALASAFIPLDTLVSIVNLGTLTAFAIVCAGVLVMRYTKPDLPRPFKVPGSPVVPALGVLACLYLMFSLPLATWIRFLVWMLIGLVIFACYGYRRAKR